MNKMWLKRSLAYLAALCGTLGMVCGAHADWFYDFQKAIVRITALALGILLFWGTAAEAQFTIMPVGDSITWGAADFSGVGSGGYRPPPLL